MTSLAQPEMLQRFTSALFGGSVEELSLGGQPEQEKRAEEEEEDEDWILVNYLGEAYTDDQNCQKMTIVGLELAAKTHEIHPQCRKPEFNITLKNID